MMRLLQKSFLKITVKKAFLLLIAGMILVCHNYALADGEAEQYSAAVSLMSQEEYAEAAAIFEALGSYEDASILAMYCKAVDAGEKGEYDAALSTFELLDGYKDSKFMILYYTARRYETAAFSNGGIDLLSLISALEQYDKLALFRDGKDRAASCRKTAYDAAVQLAENGQYQQAADVLQALGSYEDSEQLHVYYEAFALEKNGDYKGASEKFETIGQFRDSAEQAVQVLLRGQGAGDENDEVTQILEMKYQQAKTFYEQGDYDDACEIFRGIREYKDAEAMLEAAWSEKLSSFGAVGNIVTYGRYEQNNNLSDGMEPLEWHVLDVQDGKALLLCEKGIDAVPFHTEYAGVTWDQSAIREWLNQSFWGTAFLMDEQQYILNTTVDNSEIQEYSMYQNSLPRVTTKDHVFLLSYHEAFDLYLPDKESRLCAATDAAEAAGVKTNSRYIKDERPCAEWWLRSPGYSNSLGACVDYDGTIYGENVNESYVAVRPAIWVAMNKETIIANENEPEPVAAEKENTEDEAGIKAGDIFCFGHYEQDNNMDNGPEPIEWIVLDARGKNVIAISRWGLDAIPYNVNDADVTWETCTIRLWLNSHFYNTAFSGHDKFYIPQTSVDNSDLQKFSGYSATGGNNTMDFVYLLSWKEANHYFSTRAERLCAPTAYAVAKGAYENPKIKTDGRKTGIWWLRSPGKRQNSASYVGANGQCNYDTVWYWLIVRPVIRVDRDVVSLDSGSGT